MKLHIYKRLLCLLLPFLIISGFCSGVAAQATKGNIYAVVVGVSEYANPSIDLHYANKDAVKVYNLLKQRTSSDKIILLTDQSATRNNILKAAQQLFLRTRSNDIVYFFFSGHGYKGGFVAYDNGLNYDDLEKIFQKTRANRKIILADACFSGDMRTEKRKRQTFAHVTNQKVCLFLSSRTNQTSEESFGLEEGLFTYYLLEGLNGNADANHNRIVTARELFNYVSPRVKQYSNGQQVCVMWGQFEDTMSMLN